MRLANAELRERLDITIHHGTKVWSSPALHHYTNHGADHADRIGLRREERPSLVTSPLTDDERFMLLGGVYLSISVCSTPGTPSAMS